MRRLPIMSALGRAALAEAPSVRAEVTASQRHEENLSRCRVLARIFRLPNDDVRRQAAELNWDMNALERKLQGPPKQIAGWRQVVIEVGPNETAAEAARRRSDLFETVRNLPDGSVLLVSRGLADVIAFESVEHQPHHALPLSALIAPPTPPQKLHRRSKRAQRARRTIWTTTP